MPRPRLELPALVALFALGAAGGLIGDAGHVASGTTRYLSHALPFIWKSQWHWLKRSSIVRKSR